MTAATAAQQLKLRPYQREAVDAVKDAWRAGILRPAVQAPTGAGKSVIFSHLISESLADRGGRAVVMVHREELADQAVRKLRQVNPSLRVGKVKARHNEVDADVVVCSVPTLASRGRIEQIHDVRTVICDEAHHALSRTWKNALDHFGSFATTPTAGFSATLARGDRRGLGDIWEDVVFQRSTLWAIRHGYLTDIKGVGITVPDMDLSQVERSRGDYTEKGLSYALAFSGAYEVVASEYRKLAGDRPGILFAPTVADAEAFAGAFTHEGYRVGVITGTTSSAERADIYAAYEAGDLDILASCMVLTEGFDSPRAEVAVIARPTTSAALYAQMCGRVLRLDHRKPDKQALILDVAGVAEHNDLSKSLIDLAREEVTEVKDGETLAEAVEREEAEAGGQDALKARIERERIRAVEIDLFGASRHRWMQTPGGTQYLSVPDGWIYLAAGDGGWDVKFRAKAGHRDTVIAAGMDLQYAMAHGEQAGDDAAAQLVTKNARWRKRPPSEKSAAFAERLGLPRAAGANAGQTSDYISAILATRALDHRSTR